MRTWPAAPVGCYILADRNSCYPRFMIQPRPCCQGMAAQGILGAGCGDLMASFLVGLLKINPSPLGDFVRLTLPFATVDMQRTPAGERLWILNTVPQARHELYHRAYCQFLRLHQKGRALPRL